MGAQIFLTLKRTNTNKRQTSPQKDDGRVRAKAHKEETQMLSKPTTTTNKKQNIAQPVQIHLC